MIELLKPLVAPMQVNDADKVNPPTHLILKVEDKNRDRLMFRCAIQDTPESKYIFQEHPLYKLYEEIIIKEQKEEALQKKLDKDALKEYLKLGE